MHVWKIRLETFDKNKISLGSGLGFILVAVISLKQVETKSLDHVLI